MRSNEMTEAQRTAGVARYERADELMAAYKAEFGADLPLPWQQVIPGLLLQGLGDPELHHIFDAIAQVEFASGRLVERPVDYGGWTES